jgi:hypothetical protein
MPLAILLLIVMGAALHGILILLSSGTSTSVGTRPEPSTAIMRFIGCIWVIIPVGFFSYAAAIAFLAISGRMSIGAPPVDWTTVNESVAGISIAAWLYHGIRSVVDPDHSP